MLKLSKRGDKSFNGNGLANFQIREELTFGRKAADAIAHFGGSWKFIFVFLSVLASWIILNSYILLEKPYDPFPFILLNLLLSSLAAMQAPIILMAQNRQAERDRLTFRYDYAIDRKSEREIQQIQQELHLIRQQIKKR